MALFWARTGSGQIHFAAPACGIEFPGEVAAFVFLGEALSKNPAGARGILLQLSPKSRCGFSESRRATIQRKRF